MSAASAKEWDTAMMIEIVARHFSFRGIGHLHAADDLYGLGVDAEAKLRE
jgi:hypothetical protein